MQRHPELRARTGDEFNIRVGPIDVERFFEHGGGFCAMTCFPVGAAKRAEDFGALQTRLVMLEQRCEDLDGFCRLALGSKLVRACHCHSSFTSLFFELSIFHEVRGGLSELCRHVLQGLHCWADLAELDRADVSARVIGSAELRLAQSGRDTRLTQALT